MEFIKLELEENKIKEMSIMAKNIVREHFDPIIGKEQNDYMINMFQTEEAIAQQLKKGYLYYFVVNNGKKIGFMAFYPKEDVMYLSKFYLYKDERGKGYSKNMLSFLIDNTKNLGLDAIELNVNKNNSAIFAYEKLGFEVVRTEKNDIGEGFYMDDFVYRYEI